jgi:branched-chain amino acid transport system ATP-binding protein
MPLGSTDALIGRNGAGKTSLLRSIMGFMRVSQGRIMLNGTSLDKVKDGPYEAYVG